jgi:hypothetical protein
VKGSNEHPVRIPKGASQERRASTRFGLSLEIGYTVVNRRAIVRTGSGRTIDLSSSGLSFTTDQPPLPGQKLEMSIDWPVLLDGAIRLQLVMSGIVVRTAKAATAVQIQRHEFRTRRAGLKARPPEESVG